MDVDSEDARGAIGRDLSCYADQWWHLQEMEVESVYGPVHAKPAETLELIRRETCIPADTLRRGSNCIESTWAGDAGRDIVEGASVVISRQHPWLDEVASRAQSLPTERCSCP